MSGNGCGRYVYCVVQAASEETTLGKIGLDGNEVYSLPSAGLAALVHNCGGKPYCSDDEQVLRRWVIGHQQVVEAVQSRFGVVLPTRFNTIIKDTDGSTADLNVRRWLAGDSPALTRKLDRLRGQEEYGIQIFWDPRVIADVVRRTHPELVKLEAEIRSRTEGSAYMYRQHLERLLRQEVEREAESCSKEFHRSIRRCVSELRIERTRKEANEHMLMNLSCLVPFHGIDSLSHELKNIEGMDGFSARLTGPWPPYSFVAD